MQLAAKERTSRRVIPLSWRVHNRSFQKYGKICRGVQGTRIKGWGSPRYVLRQWSRESGRWGRRGKGYGQRSDAQRGVPSDIPLSLLASLHSLGHSFFSTGGKPEATGSYAPSSQLAFTERLFVADVYVVRARGEGFPLLEKFRGFCRRIPCSGE